MDDIPESIKALDMAQLRTKLREMGVNVGPIGPSAKTIFQRRLVKAIAAKSGVVSASTDATDSSSTSTVNSQDLPKLDSSADAFFALSLPENIDPQLALEVNQLVFSDRNLALKTAKKVKGSRFKVFKSQKEAEEFSKLTAEHTFSSPMKLTKQEDSSKDGTVNTESIPYRAPKPQDLVQVRRTIEKGDTKLFLEYVWNNPRYLISSGDTPVIYQEGPRYSAMHIGAMKNKPEICREILDTLENKQFIQQLYAQSKHTEESLNNRINFLVDLYLNMPDKASCESPLHMACKFGFDGVVEILAAHPKTDKQLKNKYGETPYDMICSRAYDAMTSTKTRIAELLQGQYYVPLIRSLDNSTQPVIGQPWSPDVNKSPADSNGIPSSQMSPRDPLLSIKACAGPMSPSFASDFHKKWTTPPSDSKEKTKLFLDSKRGDSEKGMERIGRYLAHEMHIPWIEHWDFLDSYVDLSTAEGLDTLEEYFTKTTWHRFIKEYKDMHGLEELYQDFDTGLSTPIKAESCDKIKSAENNERDIIKTDQKGNDGFEKDLNISRDLSKIFDSCESDTNYVNESKKDKNNGNAGDSASVEDSTDASTSAKTAVFSHQKGVKTDSLKSTGDSLKTAVANTDTVSPKGANIGQSTNVIVSPMTSLSQSFAQLTVFDESWDDKVNNNSADSTEGCDSTETTTNIKNDSTETSSNIKNSNQMIKIVKEDNQVGGRENNVNVGKRNQENLIDKTTAGDAELKSCVDSKKPDIAENNRRNIEEKKTDSEISEEQSKSGAVGQENCSAKSLNSADKDQMTVNDISQDYKKYEKKEDITNEQLAAESNVAEGSTAFVKDFVTENTDPKSDTKDKTVKFVNEDESQPASQDNQNSAVEKKRLLSERSDSTSSLSSLSSYQTAASEEFYDCNVSSPFSDTTAVGIRLMYKPILDTLKEEIDRRREQFTELDTEPVLLLVRLQASPSNGTLKVDIVVYPTNDSINELLIFENLEVKFCEGDLSGVIEGEVIEVVFTQRLVEVRLRAHFTRKENLPQPLYIHGAEPTKTDLDVFRALGDNLVLPNDHPNVFHWRISLNRFCTDNKYRWQSPAKLKATQRQSTSASTPQRKRPSSVPYGSPIGLEYADRRSLVTSEIRTALFPAIFE